VNLEARALRVVLGAKTILEDVDLVFEPGESVAVIGPNGAGKSTLLRALAGLVECDGAVLVEGDATAELDRRAMARKVAFVGQSRAPAFDFSVLEFVLMGMNARKGRFALETTDERQRALKAIDEVDLSTMASRGVQTLSGGEYQRCVMARTLVTDARIWLLDEPTSDLDPRHQLAVHELIQRHASDGGVALTVLHDLHQAARFHDRVVLIVDGQVTADGSPTEVLQSNVLAEAYGVRIERIETEYGPAFVPTSDR